MKYLNIHKKKITVLAMLSLLSYGGISFAATPIDPPNIPLESGSATSTKPNVMFIFDDSGSMNWDYLGDEVGSNICKSYKSSSISNFSRGCYSHTTGSSTAPTTFFGVAGISNYGADSLFFISSFNKIYYSPDIKYVAGVDYLKNSLGDQSFTSAKANIYNTNTVVNLNNVQETYFCKSSSTPSASELADESKCRRNGIDTPNPYNYHTQAYPDTTYRYQFAGKWTPHYNKIIPQEFCDTNFSTCSFSSSFGMPAEVRWCKVSADATSTLLMTGKDSKGLNKCQKNYDSTYKYLRIGKIERVTLLSSEYSNFANWYTYYKDRHTAMRTSVGLSFKNIDDTKRVGFITINPGSNTSSKFLAVKDFTAPQREKFYNLLYKVGISGSTPLREALSRVGRYYAGKSTGINTNMINSANPDPVQYSCQQNYAFLSTDGYWNGNNGQDLNGSLISDEDNVDADNSSRASGSFDGNTGTKGSLADVAMYYYNNDLRPAGSLGAEGVDVSEDNVPISALDQNSKQHMVTYAISLGLNGLMDFSKDYLEGKNKDFENIKQGTSGACSWTTGVCNWPSFDTSKIGGGQDARTIDDLWHATVNGRGKYYSAQNTQDIIDGLQDALNSLIAQTASSASASTSSPNITATENTLFYSTYRTVHWDGEITAKNIDPNTGDISPSSKWTASSQLNARVLTSSDTRTILTSRTTGSTTSLIPFTWASLNATEKGYLSNKCSISTSALSQCSDFDSTQKSAFNNGENLLGYLRGHSIYENQTNLVNPLYRERDSILGDIVDSSTTYVSNSPYNWTDAGYATFKASVASRTPMLYAGANDGMLHAFNANTGAEVWSFIPKQIMPNLYKLADKNYALNHQFYVNGPVSIMDANVGGNWKTVLVGSMGQGSKGYYALDITNPSSPNVLWEICTDSTLCRVTDSDLGLSYGEPIITKRSSDSKWVAYVTSGYDNASGKGIVYELDLASGTILRKLNNLSGTNISPSGLSNINTFYDNFYGNNQATAIYGGDLDGNIWKWELNNNTGSIIAKPIGKATTSSGTVQPISSRIELGIIEEKPVLFFGTGKYLSFSDYSTIDIQSVYGIKDPYHLCLMPSYRDNPSLWSSNCVSNSLTYGNLRLNPNIKEQQSKTVGTKTTALNNNSINWTNDIGWYMDFKSQEGERVNISPTLVLGTLNVVTNVPATNTCSMGGNAWIYQINFLNGNAISGQSDVLGNKHTGGFVVGQVVARLDASGAIKNFITDAGGNVQVIGVNVNNTTIINNKTSWSEIIN